jgi:hypothetical protein
MQFSLKTRRMIKRWKMVILFFGLIIYSLIVIYIMSAKLNKIQHTIPYVNQTEEITENNHNFYCKKFGEWELIDNGYFFKRSATYFFIDEHFFRLNMIKRSHLEPSKIFFHLKIILNTKNSILYHRIESTIIQSRWKVREYELVYIDAKFNLTKYFNTSLKYKFDHDGLTKSISIEIQVEIEQIGKIPVKSESNLTAKIKYLKKPFSQKSKNALVCSKCLYTHKDDFNSKKLEWWIEVNREAGYENIAFCNQSIADHSNYRNLFKKNKDFLIISQLKCIPNLLYGTDGDYFHTYSVLTDSYQIAVLDTLILSECYLNHFNDYKYIAIIDADEVVLTRKLSNFMDASQTIHYIKSLDASSNNEQKLKDSIFLKNYCNRYDSKNNESKTEVYFNELTKKVHISNSKSIYFPQAFYLKNKMIKLVFQEMSRVLKNFKEYSVNTEEIRINVLFDDVGDFTVKKRHFILDYIFTISNEHEYDYAKNLLNLYTKVIEPYLNSNKIIFEDSASDFDRFFFISGKINDFSWGKSIHNTSHVFDFTVHHANKYIVDDNPFHPFSIDWNFLNQEQAKYLTIPYKLSHLSHFRSYFHSKLNRIPISFLHIDLNYLNCYFIPLLPKISKSNIKSSS